ncbi:hypothetical protein FRB99_007794 [Tulasnella sp. 403]|nr:hypothetical protein FRB99_007794 [Tulasnella sp. 403]
MADPENQPLLANGTTHDQSPPPYQVSTARRAIGSSTVIFFVILAIVTIYGWQEGRPPKDPARAVDRILARAGVFDGHIDLPIYIRGKFRNNVTAVDLDEQAGHVDIPRLRQGRVGGFFWSVYTSCPNGSRDTNFTEPSWRVRDTLEQIDVARGLIEKYGDTFRLATSYDDIEGSLYEGRIASLLGVEGGHQLGNSLAVLRMYHALGVRYMTLTHMCHNAFADSGGYLKPLPPLHHGLSEFGYTLIKEMNRLGVIVDLSHTSDATAIQALAASAAPVMWSHSSARAVWNVARNVPDNILEMIGEGPGKKDAIVMVNFSADFIAGKGNATVEAVADHVEHIARVAGKRHVGIGSDFDGIERTPEGLEDVSKYPKLFVVLYQRGWTPKDLEGLAANNFLRIYRKAEMVAKDLQRSGAKPAMEIYDRRTDL